MESGQGWRDYTDDDHSGSSGGIAKGERSDTRSMYGVLTKGVFKLYTDSFPADIERVMVENLHKHNTVKVTWNTQPVALQIDTETRSNPNAYPITVTLENSQTGIVEKIAAKYVVGGDGARSWLRKYLNIQFSGDRTDSTWGE